LLYAESQRQASQHVLTQRRDDANALRAENARQAQEIESLKAQLATAEAKNRQMNEMILASSYSKNHSRVWGLLEVISRLIHVFW
jgi:hypothetical protein